MRIFKTFFTIIRDKFLQFVQVQLFLSITALPILVHWGLPMSYASITGNLLFVPFLTIFLLISSIIFFAEAIHISHPFLMYLLEQTTHHWTTLSTYSSPSWLFSMPKFYAPFLFIGPIITGIILCHPKIRSLSHRILVLISILIGMYSIRILIPHTPPIISTCVCQKGNVTIIHKNNKTIVIDPGYCMRLANPSSWIEYNLLSHLNTTYGTTTIDHYIALQPTTRTLDALATICTHATVRNIYFPSWNGKLSKKGRWNYRRFKENTEKQKTVIHRLGKKEFHNDISEMISLKITPLNQIKKISNISYDAYRIHLACSEQSHEIYSTHYKPK